MGTWAKFGFESLFAYVETLNSGERNLAKMPKISISRSSSGQFRHFGEVERCASGGSLPHSTAIRVDDASSGRATADALSWPLHGLYEGTCLWSTAAQSVSSSLVAACHDCQQRHPTAVREGAARRTFGSKLEVEGASGTEAHSLGPEGHPRVPDMGLN